MHCRQRADFVGLALADEQRGVGRLALADEPRDRRQTGGLREQPELFELCVEMRQPEIDPDQDGGAFTCGGSVQTSGMRG